MGKGFSCWPLGLFPNPLLLSHRAILSASPPHWPAWDPAESGFTAARSLQIYRKRRLALWLGLGDIHQPVHLWSSRVWGPHLSGELERCGAVKGQRDVASLALGFASSLSILNRDSLYSRESTASLLCLDCSSKEQTLLHFPQFCPSFFFQLHLASSQEKGLHIHPLRRTEVLPQGRCFLSLLIFFSNFFSWCLIFRLWAEPWSRVSELLYAWWHLWEKIGDFPPESTYSGQEDEVHGRLKRDPWRPGHFTRKGGSATSLDPFFFA